MESKKSLIAKLDKISTLYKTTLSIKDKTARFTSKDNYKRTVDLPPFPGEYRSEEEREEWKKSIDHCVDNAIDSMEYIYDRVCKPKEPEKPDPGNCPVNENALVNELKKKEGWKVFVFGFVAFCVLISGGLFAGDALTVVFNLVIFGACGAVIFLFYKKLLSKKKSDEEVTKTAVQAYEKNKAETEAKYEQDMGMYKTAMDSHKQKKADFMEKYTEWRKVYLAHVKEEEAIAQKLEADRVAEVKRIFEEEYLPVETELEEYNDLVSEDYLPMLDDIIGLLKSGRADDLKEAVNLYEDISYRERQLELEREKEEQRKYEAALERKAADRHHKEQMAFQKEQERRKERKEAERQFIESREREAKEKKDADKAKSDAKRQCHYCKNYHSCGIKHNPPIGCTGFRPGGSYTI